MPIGPPIAPTIWTLLYEGLGVANPLSENGAASQEDVSKIPPTTPLYNDAGPLRLLPNAAVCANDDAAPLFTLPFTSRPFAARSSFEVSPAVALVLADGGGGAGAAGALLDEF